MRSPAFAALISAALLFVACRNEATIDPGVSDATVETGLRVAAQVHLRTNDGHYLVAEEGGGGAVNANRTSAGAWETFTLLTSDQLVDGAQVLLGTADGVHFLQAELGGGHGLAAQTTNKGLWETFTLEKRGGGAISSGDEVALRTSSGHYVVAELGGGGKVNADRRAWGPWETFTIDLGRGSGGSGGGGAGGGSSGGGGASGGGASGVRPDDTVLVPPVPGGTILGTITGFEMNSHCPFPDASRCEQPMYKTYDRDTQEFWDILVQELLHSRVNVVMAHGRGCYDPSSGLGGNGNMCPRLLTRLVEAIDRAGARDVLRLGMWDDTGAYQGTRTAVDHLPESTRFDLGDRTSWRFFWDHNIKVWFDTVPRDLWYRLDGRPVIAFWSLSSYFFSNQRGNASALLRDLKARFRARYAEEVSFIVDGTWVSEDPTITTSDVIGVNDWFDPLTSNFTARSWGGQRWAAAVPGFRDPDTVPGCGRACREYGRRDGQSLRDAARQANARFMLLEGWTDVAESAGYYRSHAWRYPNQYVEIVRELSDPTTPTVRLEAEAADEFNDGTRANLGGEYRSDGLDVGRIPGGGWDVGWTEPGEWLRFKEVALACGTYRFTARVASPLDGQKLRLERGGTAIGAVTVPNTGSWDRYELVHLGERTLPAGAVDLTVTMETGGLNLDWLFVKKVASCQ